MTASLSSAATNLLGLVAMSALTLLTMLILRNPLLPKWLNNEGVVQAVSLVLTTGFFTAAIDATAELSATNIHYGVIAIIVGGAVAGSTFILWKTLSIGERLAQADAGQSPFARRQPAPTTATLHPAPTGG